MQTIKKNWVYVLLIFAVLFFIVRKVIPQKENIQLQTFKTSSGWGYDIIKDDKVFIHQEIIPAIEGFKSFITKEEAEKVGKLVLQKIKNKEGGGLPQITREEIDSLQISK
jgi:hypothetical protein